MPDSFKGSPKTVGGALSRAAQRLRHAGIERPEAEARILLETASGRGRGQIIGFPEHALESRQRDDFDALVTRRCAREPISRILGRREFWSLDFRLNPETLDPRPDSEALVAAVLERVPDRHARLDILDLGTGTGCLLLALLTELPEARGVGVDISAAAVSASRDNAAELHLGERTEFLVSDWARDLSAQFDVIVSNPPYIESGAIDALAPEVARFDPRLALDGGADGLEAYRQLLPEAARLSRPGGLLALEIGAGQGASVRKAASGAGFSVCGSASDLSGIERCLLFGR
jgi:release factor glutamine methyltransferase